MIIALRLALALGALPTHIPAGHYARAARINAAGYVLYDDSDTPVLVETVHCTVNVRPGMSYRVERGPRPWLRFYDARGEEEGDCQLAVREPGTVRR